MKRQKYEILNQIDNLTKELKEAEKENLVVNKTISIDDNNALKWGTLINNLIITLLFCMTFIIVAKILTT